MDTLYDIERNKSPCSIWFFFVLRCLLPCFHNINKWGVHLQSIAARIKHCPLYHACPQMSSPKSHPSWRCGPGENEEPTYIKVHIDESSSLHIQRHIVACELDIDVFKSILLPIRESEQKYLSTRRPSTRLGFCSFRWRSAISICYVRKFIPSF